ncbi:RsfA family transcriptional regulator [Ornithinibacillus sp. 4-3]|uniref:RsfA family transcriptional regulator n=1 Tax=Ornithinibacillus sp. 4-3 TaxID=3231488 RepID=A0AB39HUN6_9BACI
MKKQRQDAWSKDEDMLLAEIVLRYIREGKTQLEAFKHVAEELSRSASACGFRWNATVRKQFEQAIRLAKEERKLGKGHQDKNRVQPPNQDTIEQAIAILKQLKSHHVDKNDVEESVVRLQNENKELKALLERYEAAWIEMRRLWEWVNQPTEKI